MIRSKYLKAELTSYLVTIALCVSTLGGTALYYKHESIKQTHKTSIDYTKIFKDENGKSYYYFDIGEHFITVSRNDAYYHKSEEIEGYVIKDVEINGWRDNNKITYVNIVPVIVEATNEKNGQFEFDDFGTIFTPKNKTKKYTP